MKITLSLWAEHGGIHLCMSYRFQTPPIIQGREYLLRVKVQKCSETFYG